MDLQLPAYRSDIGTRLNALLTNTVPVRPATLSFDRPVASITFDDFPRSAWTVGGPLLEAAGARGTYYTTAELCGVTLDGVPQYGAEDLRALHARGHEVACHGGLHRPASRTPTETLEQDCEANAAFVRQALGPAAPAMTSYAYPYGEASLRTGRLFSTRFDSCRGIRPGVNVGRTDLGLLKAVPLEARAWSAQLIENWIERACLSKGWIVFFTHDVAEDATPFGATPAMLSHCLDVLARSGVAILTVRDALAEGLRQPAAARSAA